MITSWISASFRLLKIKIGLNADAYSKPFIRHTLEKLEFTVFYLNPYST